MSQPFDQIIDNFSLFLFQFSLCLLDYFIVRIESHVRACELYTEIITRELKWKYVLSISFTTEPG